MKKRPTQSETDKERKDKLDQGFLDGRFRSRVVKDKKKHSDKYKARKNKQNEYS